VSTPHHDHTGFDETLFETLRTLTAEERLRLDDRTIQMIKELRRGFGVADDAARRAAER
jgi:hypothetical protein